MKELNNRKRVAQKLIEQIHKGEKINKEKAVREAGYKESTARSRTTDIVNSEQCQDELKTLLSKMEEIREKDINELLTDEVRAKLTPRDRVDSIDKISKNIQLLSGKATANERIEINWTE